MGRVTPFFLSGLLASVSPLVSAQSYGSYGSASSGSSSGTAASSAGVAPPAASGASTGPTIDLTAIGLHTLAAANGKLFFGTATDTNLFNDTAYMQIVNDRNEFGILVPENSQKWQPTEPTQDDFVFTNPDRVRSLAVSNQQRLRCHTLTWFQQLPNFVTQTAWTRQTLTAAIQTHISNVVGHFKGQCYSWDVVNEALNDNGTFRNSVFFNTLGTDFIPISFAAAAAADPGAKLYYNDFNLEFNQNKTDSAVAIVNLVRQAGERIDGVGFQAHMTTGETPTRQQIATVLSRFTALNLEVALTELDVRQTSLPPNASAIQQQANDYVSMVGGCLDVANCVGIVAWEYTDRYSWIPSTFPGTGSACLFDENLQPKPAYTAVVSALAAKATGLPAGATIAGIGANGNNGNTGNTNNNSGAGSTSGGANTGSNAGTSSYGSGSTSSTTSTSSSGNGNGEEFNGNFGGSPGQIPAANVGTSNGNMAGAEMSSGGSMSSSSAGSSSYGSDSTGSSSYGSESMTDSSSSGSSNDSGEEFIGNFGGSSGQIPDANAGASNGNIVEAASGGSKDTSSPTPVAAGESLGTSGAGSILYSRSSGIAALGFAVAVLAL